MVKNTENVISLYSGGGGLDIGFRLAVPNARTVCYVEREISSVSVLVNGIEKGILDDAPIWTNSTTFDGSPWVGKVDWIIGGFPCQPWSVAGKREGKEDDRWLWDDIKQIAMSVQPKGFFLENVSGLITGHGIDTILGDLSEMGFDAQWGSVKAGDIGATHRRERVFILAYKRSIGWRRWSKGNEERIKLYVQTQGSFSKCSSEMGDTSKSRHINKEEKIQSGRHSSLNADNSELDDTEHNGWSATEEQGSDEQTVSGSEKRENAAIESKGTDNTSAAQQGLENSNDSRFHRTQPDGAERERKEIDQEQRGFSLSRSRGSSEDNELDDTNGKRPEVQVQWQHAVVKQSGGTEPKEINITTFPPGPDSEQWADIIGQYPELSPALEKSAFESDVRGMANGMAVGLHRTDRLRILGNGVVPIQAAYAFTVLARRFQE